MTEEQFFHQLEALGTTARPLNDDDWGSDRQIAAQNEFFDFLKLHMHPMAFEEFEMWCLKATTDEMIDEGIRLMREV